ncbi:MAG: ABC transporter permease subunit [Candidatus Latescibacteria bacterium]|nr:ABC transporter permease subunit [Candidatus Latescibacterota bacterium]NIM66326.1 ABC transporter permease subunit [Candidatus Latescibacterota bacterium]NIO02805.1 ABC transporter permease subunit [Candidatus Latescibacterota bacterium]NIO29940.1 ABC transporter permease subunit [Candidatus Latescibacterota bacterium]NIO57555.1 ABC transporter permease subunit [Candidatus Latescibacterota bacterium]
MLATSSSELSGAFGDEELWSSIWLTLRAAGIATLIGSMFGIPLAYLLARARFPGRALVLGIIDLPIMIPHSAAGIALLAVIGRHSLAQKVSGPLGIQFVGEEAGIAVAMAFVSVPFLANAAREGFAAVPERLEKVARTLGATPSRVFFTISLPLAWRPILSGMVLMWARGISEFGAVIIIAYHPMTTPVLVFQRFNDYGLTYARVAAVVLILVCVVGFTILRFLTRPARREAK